MSAEESKAPKPEKDKKPANAFFMYTKSVRDSVKSQNPTLNNREITKKISEDWKALPEPEKKVFQDEFEAQSAEYRRTHPKTNEKKAPKLKKSSEPKQPIKKRPANK